MLKIERRLILPFSFIGDFGWFLNPDLSQGVLTCLENIYLFKLKSVMFFINSVENYLEPLRLFMHAMAIIPLL